MLLIHLGYFKIASPTWIDQLNKLKLVPFHLRREGEIGVPRRGCGGGRGHRLHRRLPDRRRRYTDPGAGAAPGEVATLLLGAWAKIQLKKFGLSYDFKNHFLSVTCLNFF